MKIDLPKKVKEILNVIEENGHEAYVVGGCVRDSILGRQPEDWDITTSAKPEEVKALFRRTIDTGIAHGTVTVMMGDDGFEVTTYRVDGKYEDGRHPSEVLFTPNLKEDLRRRDFTINAMAYNEKNGLVDLYNGVYDLKYKNIRCVGNADERFDEDALRILRAVRFAAQLDFGIERETYAAICRHAENLRKVSSERIAARSDAEPTTTQSTSLKSAVVPMVAIAVCARVLAARIPAYLSHTMIFSFVIKITSVS